jgi:hypothetical protein
VRESYHRSPDRRTLAPRGTDALEPRFSPRKNTISVASFSEMSQFLNYEMLVRLSREIPKFVVPSSGR